MPTGGRRWSQRGPAPNGSRRRARLAHWSPSMPTAPPPGRRRPRAWHRGGTARTPSSLPSIRCRRMSSSCSAAPTAVRGCGSCRRSPATARSSPSRLGSRVTRPTPPGWCVSGAMAAPGGPRREGQRPTTSSIPACRGRSREWSSSSRPGSRGGRRSTGSHSSSRTTAGSISPAWLGGSMTPPSPGSSRPIPPRLRPWRQPGPRACGPMTDGSPSGRRSSRGRCETCGSTGAATSSPGSSIASSPGSSPTTRRGRCRLSPPRCSRPGISRRGSVPFSPRNRRHPTSGARSGSIPPGSPRSTRWSGSRRTSMSPPTTSSSATRSAP